MLNHLLHFGNVNALGATNATSMRDRCSGETLPSESRRSRRIASRTRLACAFAEGTYWSGVGGTVTFTPDVGGVPVIVNNTEWNRKNASRLAEVTNAQSAGSTKWIAGPKEQSGSFTVVFDSTAVPEAVGIVEGALGTIKELLGNSTKGKQQSVIIESLDWKVNTQSGAIMVTVSYKGNGPITNL